MNKDLKTNMAQLKKIEKVILIILLIPIALIVISFGFRMVVDKIDHDKFITLDNQMKGLYGQFQKAADGKDNWQYKTLCSANHDGDFENGTYNCIASIAVRKNIKSLDELTYYHNLYFPIVEKSDLWDGQKSSAFDASYDFGKKFAVSVASKDYSEKKTGIQCRYGIALGQLYGNEDYYPIDNTFPGSKLQDDTGDFFISLRCDEMATQSWYTKVDTTSNIVP